MAMTKTLFSISALATELGRDRRTIATALSGVPGDGTLQGNPAWILSSALSALERHDGRGRRTAGSPSHARSPAYEPDRVLDHFASRVRGWRELPKTGHRYGFEEAAQTFTAGDRQALLTWLRAGCPYVERGDWETGEGFVLASHWLIDWMVLLAVRAQASGDEQTARFLRLDLVPK
jgi:hypothetical protein